MSILQSFELFWSLPEKLFGKKIFRVFHVETPKAETVEDVVQVEKTDDEVQLTIYNCPKAYSLLTSVLYKKKLLNENKNGKIYNQRSIS